MSSFRLPFCVVQLFTTRRTTLPPAGQQPDHFQKKNFPPPNHQSPITNHLSPLTSHLSPLTPLPPPRPPNHQPHYQPPDPNQNQAVTIAKRDHETENQPIR